MRTSWNNYCSQGTSIDRDSIAQK